MTSPTIRRFGTYIDLSRQRDPYLVTADRFLDEAWAAAREGDRATTVTAVTSALRWYERVDGTQLQQAKAWCVLADISQRNRLTLGEAANAYALAIGLLARAQEWELHRTVCLRLAALQENRGMPTRADAARRSAEEHLADVPAARLPHRTVRPWAMARTAS